MGWKEDGEREAHERQQAKWDAWDRHLGTGKYSAPPAPSTYDWLAAQKGNKTTTQPTQQDAGYFSFSNKNTPETPSPGYVSSGSSSSDSGWVGGILTAAAFLGLAAWVYDDKEPAPKATPTAIQPATPRVVIQPAGTPDTPAQRPTPPYRIMDINDSMYQGQIAETQNRIFIARQDTTISVPFVRDGKVQEYEYSVARHSCFRAYQDGGILNMVEGAVSEKSPVNIGARTFYGFANPKQMAMFDSAIDRTPGRCSAEITSVSNAGVAPPTQEEMQEIFGLAAQSTDYYTTMGIAAVYASSDPNSSIEYSFEEGSCLRVLKEGTGRDYVGAYNLGPEAKEFLIYEGYIDKAKLQPISLEKGAFVECEATLLGALEMNAPVTTPAAPIPAPVPQKNYPAMSVFRDQHTNTFTGVSPTPDAAAAYAYDNCFLREDAVCVEIAAIPQGERACVAVAVDKTARKGLLTEVFSEGLSRLSSERMACTMAADAAGTSDDHCQIGRITYYCNGDDMEDVVNASVAQDDASAALSSDIAKRSHGAGKVTLPLASKFLIVNEFTSLEMEDGQSANANIAAGGCVIVGDRPPLANGSVFITAFKRADHRRSGYAPLDNLSLPGPSITQQDCKAEVLVVGPPPYPEDMAHFKKAAP